MTTQPKLIGRPPKKPKDSIYTTALYRLLHDNLPLEFIAQDGRINTLVLATRMNRRRMTIYRWFNGGQMSPKALNMLLEISAAAKCERKGKLTLEKLLPFAGF